MDEYETVEKELKVVYESYVERFRNMSYLESELQKYHTAEVEKKMESDRSLQRMRKKCVQLCRAAVFSCSHRL